MLKRHPLKIARYFHSKPGNGQPCEGIDNLRPETEETVNTFMVWPPES